MPELPEVETIRRGLERSILGLPITGVEQRRPDLRFPLPTDLGARLVGRQVRGVGRRAKYLILDLDDGNAVLLHLGMSGRLVLDGPPQGAHEHLTFEFDRRHLLRFVDPRRFGSLDLCPRDELGRHPRLATLGLEPLDDGFDGRALALALA
ncbi:MAG: DNA-formamidopyrimidine glycosylase family protein, partial [Geminicoccaceae bacterium]|nr:DNA-formamidopyrimidine glycosylase family protein [Geminicoccaceae bacterium]